MRVRWLTPVLLAAAGIAQTRPPELDAARSLIRAGKNSEAAATLRKFVAATPESADGHAMLGMVLLDELRLPEAGTELEKAIRLDPRRVPAIEALARVRLLQGAPANAAALLRPVAAVPEADDVLRILLAQATFAAGDFAGAAAIADHLLAADSRRPLDAYLVAVRSHIALKQYPAAADVCEQGMRVHPDSNALVSMYLLLPAGVLADRLAKRFAAAEQSSDVAEWVALGRVLSDLDPGRKTAGSELAEKTLLRAVTVEPRNAAAWYFYGRALSRRAPDSAFKAWDKALSLDPADELRVRILTQIARRKQSLSDWDGADAAFRAAQATNAKLPVQSAEAAFDYVQFLKSRSRLDEAGALLHGILAGDPMFLPAHAELARMFVQREQWSDAVREGELVVRTAGDNPGLLRSAHAVLARAYNALGQPEKARLHQAWIETHQIPKP